MKYKKILVLLLLFCMLFVSVSCKNNVQNNTDQNSDASTAGQLLASELPDYTVIIPENLSADEKTAVNALVKSVQKDFKVILNVKIDTSTEPSAKEILIGSTNRSQTETVSKTIRYGEYYVGFSDNKLVILGSTTEDTVSAIEYFADLLSKRATATVLFDGQKDLYYAQATFDVEDISINGVSLSEYTIVYTDANTKREKRFAELIQEVVVKKSGIQVPIQSSKKDVYGNVLFVGKTATQSGLAASESVVEVRGKTENDLFFAVQTLVKRISETQTGVIQVDASEQLSYTTADLNLKAYGITPDRISLMSYNTQNAGDNPYDSYKFEKLAAMIDFNDPDFVCMQECVAGSGAADSIRNKMKHSNDYLVLRSDTTSATSTSTNAILYNKTKYTLLASETVLLRKAQDGETPPYWDRYFLWARMKSKLSNATFVVICIHVDYVKEAANEEFSSMLSYVKENFEGLPVLVAGDFNLMKPELAFDYLEKQGFEDTAETAERSKNGSEKTFPQSDEKGPRTIDFIYESGFSTNYFEVMTQEVNPSDHRPIYSECYIDLNK